MAGEQGPEQWPRWTAVLALGVLGVLLLSTVADVVLNVRRPGDLVPSPGPAVAPLGAALVSAVVVASVRIRLHRRHRSWSRRAQAAAVDLVGRLEAERALPAQARPSAADDASLDRALDALRAAVGSTGGGASTSAAQHLVVARDEAAGWELRADVTREVLGLDDLLDRAGQLDRSLQRELRRGSATTPGSSAAGPVPESARGRAASRWRAVARRPWFGPVAVISAVALLFAVRFVPSADAGEVGERLEEIYGVPVEWDPNGSYERDTLIVDGQDLSEDCRVTGDWGPLDDLAIECDGATGPVPVPVPVPVPD